MSARTRRIENERQTLQMLIRNNAGRLRLSGPDEVWLSDLPWYASPGGDRANGLRIRFEFPEYYPAVPLEARVLPPVCHPNVHPDSGFVCLWEGHHAGTSLVEAVLQTMRVVTWHLVNWHPVHIMQDVPQLPVLAYLDLSVPSQYYLERSAAELPEPRRIRLSQET